MVGATSRSAPSRRGIPASTSGPASTTGTGLVVCAVCGPLRSASHMRSALPWSAVTMTVAPALPAAAKIRARQPSSVSTAATVASSRPVWPTMSALAKLQMTTSCRRPARSATRWSVTASALIDG